jgi:hypothetical protein
MFQKTAKTNEEADGCCHHLRGPGFLFFPIFNQSFFQVSSVDKKLRLVNRLQK